MKTNNLAAIAERFIEACRNIQKSENHQVVDLMPVLKTLEHLMFDERYAFEGITPGNDGMGGETSIYAYPKDGNRPDIDDLPDVHMRDEHIEDCRVPCVYEYDAAAHVRVDGTPESIWEFYLFTEMWRFLPLWWHANYALRKYITNAYSLLSIAKMDPFNLEESEKTENLDSLSIRDGFISEIDSDNLIALNGDRYLLPSVTKDGDTYEITYCYWSEWSGLSRVRLFALVADGTAFLVGDSREIRLVNFDCGIMF